MGRGPLFLSVARSPYKGLAHLAEEVEGARGGLLLMGVQEEEGQLVVLQRQAAVIHPRLGFLLLLPSRGILPLCTASQGVD